MKNNVFSKVLVMSALVLLLVMACALGASAETYSGTCGAEEDNATWSLDTETGVLNISGTGALADYADSKYLPWNSYRNSVKSIVISEGITKIGEKNFYNHFNLATVSFPESLQEIGDLAFYGAQISTISIPKNVTSIAQRAFSICPITSITIDSENTVYYTENNCIIEKDTKKLVEGFDTSTIPEDIVSIGDEAFRMCYKAKSIHIPASVQSIGEYVFSRCYGLTSITVDKNNEKYYAVGGCLIEKESGKLLAGTKNAVIPDDSSVKIIGKGAFYAMFNITPVVIPDSVVTIEDEAFYQYRYSTIDIPESVTTIGNNAFANSSLQTVSIQNDSVEIYPSENTFPARTVIYGYEGSTAATYAETYGRTFESLDIIGGTCGVEGNEENVKWKFNSATGVLTVFGSGAMADYGVSAPMNPSDVPWREYRYQIKSVVIENGITRVGNSAFAQCLNVFEISLPDTLISIGDYAFCYTSSKSLHIPKNVGVLGRGTFSRSNKNLTSITVDEANTTFHSNGNCLIETATKTLIIGCATSVIPDDGSVTKIGLSAFANNTHLKEIIIPACISYIGDYAFSRINSLESIKFNGILNYVGDGAFSGCPETSKIYFAQSEASGTWHPGWLTWAEGYHGTLVWGTKSAEEYSSEGLEFTKRGDAYMVSGYTGSSLFVEIPEVYKGLPVNAVGIYAFGGSDIMGVIIPETVSRIERQSFINCTNLSTVTIKGFVDYIGFNAFYNLAKPATITFEKQANDLPTWHASWYYPKTTTYFKVNYGETEYMSSDCHDCNGTIKANPLPKVVNGVPTWTCTTCGATKEYGFVKNSALLGLDFESSIESQIPSNMTVAYWDNIRGTYHSRENSNSQVYRVESTTWMDDSSDHVVFAPDKMFIEVDVMFDLDIMADVEKESILTFLPGLKHGEQLGTNAAFEYVLRYYKGADGVHKLTYMDNPGAGKYIEIEDDKWYHCCIIADRSTSKYYVYIDDTYIGYLSRNDYTQEMFGGYTTLRLGDNKGTKPYFDNLYIYSFDDSVDSLSCEERGVDHIYTNGCDKICDSCGEQRETEHVFGTVYSSDSSAHWYECLNCGARSGETEHTKEYIINELGHQSKCLDCENVYTELLQHKYDNNCDSSCNVCGYEREVTHNYQNTHDENNHWKICFDCNAETEPAEHIVSTEYNENYHWDVCSECGYNITGKSRHDYWTQCDEKCKLCDYTRTVEHSYGTEWKNDADYHWYECEKCGKAKKDQAFHTWDSGVAQDNATLYTCTLCGRQQKVMSGDSSTSYRVVITSKTECPYRPTDHGHNDVTFMANLYFEEIPSVKSILIRELIYDKELLTLESAKWMLEDKEGVSEWDKDTETGTFLFGGTDNVAVNGLVLKLIFSVDKSYVGETEISVDIAINKRNYADGTDTAVNATVVPGIITFVEELEYVKGDIDGDGNITSDDALYLLRHSMKPGKYPVKNPHSGVNGDANGDGKVKIDDAIYLLRYTFDPIAYPLN